MAKQPPSPIGRSKVRMFYVDADLASGEMEQLTEALRNAIRPTHIITRPAAPLQIAGNGKTKTEPEVELDEASELETESETAPEEQVVRSSKPRKYRSPKVLSDLDMSGGGKAFADFANERGNPTEIITRYLIAAYWLAEFAGIESISADHVYTCYRSADWNFDVQDPTFPFRQLKRRGFGDTKDGKFTINHIGRSRVEKLGTHVRTDG